MPVKRIFVFFLSFLLVCLPVMPVSASTVAGQMVTKGTAEINGVTAPATTSVFIGDRIATGKDSATSLSFSGGDAAVISAMSKAALSEKEGRLGIHLEEGTLSVLDKSGKPISIDARGALIHAIAGQASVYDVILNGNSLRVISRGGLVRVETANKSAELQPGNELDATLVPPSPDPANPPQTPTGTSLASTWVILTVAAVGVTGIILGAVSLHKVSNCQLISPNIVC